MPVVRPSDVYVPDTVPANRRVRVAEILSSVHSFAKLLKVQHKDSKKLIPFSVLPMQQKIFDAVEAGHKRIAIIKARQVAATTGCKIVLQWLATVTKHEALHAIVSMREDSASSLLKENRNWIEHPPTVMQRKLSKKSKGDIVFEGTRASIKAFTSRSESGLRSFSPAAAVISEAAYAPDLSEVIAQADAAVGDGLLIVESTANNPGDFFSKLVQGAPDNGWHLITLWWWEHPSYSDPPENVPGDFGASLTPEERQLQACYSLTLGQLHWRRRTCSRLGSDHKFRREYPANLEDCFLDREGGYFSAVSLEHVIPEEPPQTGGTEIEAPTLGDKYVMGVDIGGGVGGDYSTMCVVSVSTRQVVYTERSNALTPSQWAHRVVQVATRYNQALILAESNNHGHAFLLELGYCRYTSLWVNPSTGKPWVTTLPSKLDAFDTLREATPLLRVLDRVTLMELRSLTIPPGKVAPEAPKGGNDDAAMACALAYRCLRDIPASWRMLGSGGAQARIESVQWGAQTRRLRSSAGKIPFS